MHQTYKKGQHLGLPAASRLAKEQQRQKEDANAPGYKLERQA